jgi:RsiW-degrading membrane proteinase PrsW (M82 family)
MTHALTYLAVCLVPAVLWLWWIRRQDVYEPEPVGLMLKTFAAGMGAAVVAVAAEGTLIQLLLPGPEGFRFVEEALKFLVVRFGAFRSPEFNEPMDGIVYMVSAAIGFATLENARYMLGFGAGVLVLRMVLSSFLHVACSAIVGYYLGLVRFKARLTRSLYLKGLGAAILLHGAYDFVALYQPAAGLLALCALMGLLYLLRERFLGEIQKALAQSPFKPRRSLLRRKQQTEA